MKSKYKQLKELNDAEFRRLTGVKRDTFFKMLGILKAAQKKLKVQGGRPNKLSLPHQLLKCDNSGKWDLFFSEWPSDQAQAKAICLTCPAAPQCLADALERDEPDGVWGAHTTDERHHLVKRLQRLARRHTATRTSSRRAACAS